jgi:hypothetical protein
MHHRTVCAKAVTFLPNQSYSHYKQFWRHHNNPWLNEGPWTITEEYLLVKLARRYNKSITDKKISWLKIAKRLGTNRKGSQCLRKYNILKNKKYKEHNLKCIEVQGLNGIYSYVSKKLKKLSWQVIINSESNLENLKTYFPVLDILFVKSKGIGSFRIQSTSYRFHGNIDFFISPVILPELGENIFFLCQIKTQRVLVT